MICIIPASGASTRFPYKNIALLCGKPLLDYTVEAALESKVFDSIYVSSESYEILNIAERFGVTPLIRPTGLASDRAQIKHVCLQVLEEVPCDEFAVLGIPNPLRSAQDVRDAYDAFKLPATCLMSVSEYHNPPQRAIRINNGLIEPWLGAGFMLRTQDLEKLYRCDGSIIMANTEAFKKIGDFYRMKVVPFYTPKERAVDIDYREDLEWTAWKLGCAS